MTVYQINITYLLICWFIAQAIDIHLLKNLTPELIKELIPNVGSRMRFITKWEEHFGTSKNVILFLGKMYLLLLNRTILFPRLGKLLFRSN